MLKTRQIKFVIISILGLLATVLSQTIWISQSLTFTTNKLKKQINEDLNVAMFKEAEMRACSALTSITISDVNGTTPDITVFNDELYKSTKTHPDLNIIDSILHIENDVNYKIYYIEKGMTIPHPSNYSSFFQ